MKYLAIITLAIACMSCDNLSETELALKKYIQANSDNPGSYKSIGIDTVTEADLIRIPDIRRQFDNVEDVIFRIHRIAISAKLEFEDVLHENTLSKFDKIISMYNGDEELRFTNMDEFSSESLKLQLSDVVKEVEFANSEKKRRLYAQASMLESAADRLKVETDEFFKRIRSRLLLSRNLSVSEISANIENGNLIIHEYRVKQSGATVLKSELFIFDEGEIIGSVAVEIPEK